MDPQANWPSHSTLEAPSQLYLQALGLCIEIFNPNCPLSEQSVYHDMGNTNSWNQKLGHKTIYIAWFQYCLRKKKKGWIKDKREYWRRRMTQRKCMKLLTEVVFRFPMWIMGESYFLLCSFGYFPNFKNQEYSSR